MSSIAKGLLMAPQFLMSVFSPPPEVSALNVASIRCNVADYEITAPLNIKERFEVLRDGLSMSGSNYRAAAIEFSGWDEDGSGYLEWRFGRPGEYLRVDLYKGEDEAIGTYEGSLIEEAVSTELTCVVDRKS
jgi:hypothetical protein